MINLDQFLGKYNGRPNLLYNQKDRSLAGHCVQYACFYVVEVLGTPVIWANAADWYGKAGNQYERVAPQHLRRGDLVIWTGALPGSAGAGHIAIFLQNNGSTFVSSDSNWGGKFVHNVTHNWSHVVGGLRKRTAPTPPPAPRPQQQPQGAEMIADRNQAIRRYQELRPNGHFSEAEINGTAGRRTHDQFSRDAEPEVRARDANLRAQAEHLANLQSTINQLNQTVTDLRNTASQDALKDADVAKQLDQSHARIAELTTQLETSHDQLKDLQASLPTANPEPAKVEALPADTKPKVSPIFRLLSLVVLKLKKK